MTEAERNAATVAYMDAHAHEWQAWHARPIAERNAILDKVNHTISTSGILAGRAMARALGMPSVPDELCDPVEVLEACRATNSGSLQATAEELGFDLEELGLDIAPSVRLDH